MSAESAERAWAKGKQDMARTAFLLSFPAWVPLQLLPSAHCHRGPERQPPLCPKPLEPPPQSYVKSAFSVSLLPWHLRGLPWGSAGEESACNAGDLGRSLGREDPLRKGKAAHSSALSWRIPWTACSTGSHAGGHGCVPFTLTSLALMCQFFCDYTT